MVRTLIAGASAAVVLTAGLVGMPAAGAEYEPYGSTSAKKQVLKPGCKYYHYRYRVDVPSDNWAAETFLVNPRGVTISSGAYLGDFDPDTDGVRWRLCRASLRAGVYKIRMKVTYKVGYDKVEGFVKPSYFRLVRRR